MGIILIGASHRTAPVEIREKIAFSEEECLSALQRLISAKLVDEALILSTCNRVELLAVTSDDAFTTEAASLIDFLTESSGLPEAELKPHLYSLTEEDAVRHIFRVAASLDSMVVGEPQILGQLRRAFFLAESAESKGPILNKLLPQAFHVAKRVRNETDIAGSAVSVSYMAVELGRKIFDSLMGSTVLVVGGGETAELAARHLIKSGVGRVLFANRTKTKSEELASRFGGTAVAMDRLVQHLAEADIVICSTSSPDYVITSEMVLAARALRRQTPVFFIDISVPRNIDPKVGTMEKSFVFNIDDLKSLVLSNIEKRQREARRAELIVDQELSRFRQVLQSLKLGPAIARVTERMREIALEELARHRTQLGLLSVEQESALEALVLATVKKLAHPIITQMRRDALEAKL